MPTYIQIPTNAPHPDTNEPLDVSNPFELIVYVIIPVVLLLFYFLLRKRNKNDTQNH